MGRAEWFNRTAKVTARACGHPYTFAGSVALVVIWAVLGPVFHYSDTWQLVINTATTVLTFLVVFLIQNTQNRDAAAMQIKLDELIRAVRGAKNQLVALEDLSDEELDQYKARFAELAARARTRASGDTDCPELPKVASEEAEEAVDMEKQEVRSRSTPDGEGAQALESSQDAPAIPHAS
jgi:low affinity Fe/Cu permease